MMLFTNTFRRFVHALSGIVYAIRRDTSIRQHVLLGGVLCVFWYVVRPLTELELAALTFAWVLVFITELQNSAFERALDRIHPERNKHIGHSKDMAAGAVLLAGTLLFCVVIVIAIRHYW